MPSEIKKKKKFLFEVWNLSINIFKSSLGDSSIQLNLRTIDPLKSILQMSKLRLSVIEWPAQAS